MSRLGMTDDRRTSDILRLREAAEEQRNLEQDQLEQAVYYGMDIPNTDLKLVTKRVLDCMWSTAGLTLLIGLISFFHPGQAQMYDLKPFLMSIVFAFALPVYVIMALRNNSAYLMLLYMFGTATSLAGVCYLVPSWRASWIVVLEHRELCAEDQGNQCLKSAIALVGSGWPTQATCTLANADDAAYPCWDCTCFQERGVGRFEFTYRIVWILSIILGTLHLFCMVFSSRLACALLAGEDIVRYYEEDLLRAEMRRSGKMGGTRSTRRPRENTRATRPPPPEG